MKILNVRILVASEFALGFLCAFLSRKFGVPDACAYESIRTGLFSGMLAMVGFSLTIKSLLVVNIVKAFHDSPTTKETAVELAKYDRLDHLYKPLKDLRDLLVVPAVSCLLAAFAQFTFGLSTRPWAIAVAVGFAAVGFASVIWAIVIMWHGVTDWIDQLSHDKTKDVDKNPPTY